MSGTPVLIAALSGRALAASARRAGYVPYVADAFADLDTRVMAAGCEAVAGALARGFRANSLGAALERLSASCGAEPAGLVLGAGFEDTPRLVEALGNRFKLAGCGADAISAAKDPARFFGLLRELGILHPETSLEPPRASSGWLSKRVGACGGRHIRRLSTNASSRRNRYFQKEAAGTALSATAVASPLGTAFAFTQSWCAPYPKQPFRFGGIVSVDAFDPDLEARLIDTCLSLIKPLGLVGLVSFDFIVTEDGDALLIEVNPRPGASLDILDDTAGTLFKAHMAAVLGGDPVEILAASWQPQPSAAAYLYADRGGLTVPAIDWPDWVSDIPAAGQKIPTGAPIATVHARAETPQQAHETCQERLAKLGGLVYESQND